MTTSQPNLSQRLPAVAVLGDRAQSMDTHATSFRYMKSSKEVWWVVPSLMFVTFTGTPGTDRESSGPPGWGSTEQPVPTTPPSPSTHIALNGCDRYGVPMTPSKPCAGGREGARKPPRMKGKNAIKTLAPSLPFSLPL